MADGTTKTYRYPISAAKRKRKAGDTLGDLIKAWESSPEWKALAPNTQKNYLTYVRPLTPMQHVQAVRIERKQIIAIRNAVAQSIGVGASTGFVRAASALFGWGLENGWLKTIPTLKLKRLKGGTLPAWSQDEADLAISKLPEHLRRAVILALYTGQRRSDLIRMQWSSYDGRVIRLTQKKTGTPLVIPVHPILKAELDTWRGDRVVGTMILLTKFGQPWQDSNLSNQLSDGLARIDGFPPHKNIHGLRKLAAVRLAECGCSLHEIGAITGHRSLAMLQLYTAAVDQERLAESAIVRLSDARATKAENAR